MLDWYPPAEALANGYVYGSYLTGAKPRIVWHTTETSGLPGYDGGALAPHLTYDPKTRKWYQHARLSGSVGALRDVSGGTRTNRQAAFQVEIICYSAKKIADQQPYRMWVGDLPNTALHDLADFAVWCFTTHAIPLELHPLTMARTDGSAYGSNSPTRMSIVDWESRTFAGEPWGWCGHRNVPENTHWDPGALDIPAMLTYAREKVIGDMTRFSDVPADHAFHKEIEWLAGSKITSGLKADDPSTPDINEAIFGPDKEVTRGQMAAFLYRALFKTGLLDQEGKKV